MKLNLKESKSKKNKNVIFVLTLPYRVGNVDRISMLTGIVIIIALWGTNRINITHNIKCLQRERTKLLLLHKYGNKLGLPAKLFKMKAFRTF